MKTAVAILAVAVAGAGLVYLNQHGTDAATERRYAEHEHAVRRARADLHRDQQECVAQGIEFGADARRECAQELPERAAVLAGIARDAQQSMSDMKDRRCPGSMSFCGPAPAHRTTNEPNPFDQFIGAQPPDK